MPSHYFKTKVTKMGKWDLLPADTECWMTADTSRYFRDVFGIGKGILCICTLDDGMEHPYVPINYIKELYSVIDKITSKDYKGLEKKLKKFYPFKAKAKTTLPKINPRNLQKLTNKQLISIYKKNRDICHRATVFDQFAWIAEDYWTPKMEEILTTKLGLTKGSDEYHRVLFALTKPEEISTTLEEKRAVIGEAIKIKSRQQTITKAAKLLARKFGFMPIFAYGDPWGELHYVAELGNVLKKKLPALKSEYQELKDYNKLRNKDLNDIIKKYKIDPKDLQIFIDFGLALDTRNEGEYLVSLSGYYLLPIYKEIARRLALTMYQLRILYEEEIIACLEGRLDPAKTLQNKGKIVAYGFDKSMTKRYNFPPKEAANLFHHIESYVENIQGADEHKGLCASSGKVQGKAKIVTTIKDQGKVKNGDILVTHTTSVDSLPAMKRAAAFVTEIGGLTCHAAVVAREFGVPCITALKNATQNFKDGDIIEVDADNGIVKKVNA